MKPRQEQQIDRPAEAGCELPRTPEQKSKKRFRALKLEPRIAPSTMADGQGVGLIADGQGVCAKMGAR